MLAMSFSSGAHAAFLTRKTTQFHTWDLQVLDFHSARRREGNTTLLVVSSGNHCQKAGTTVSMAWYVHEKRLFRDRSICFSMKRMNLVTKQVSSLCGSMIRVPKTHHSQWKLPLDMSSLNIENLLASICFNSSLFKRVLTGSPSQDGWAFLRNLNRGLSSTTSVIYSRPPSFSTREISSKATFGLSIWWSICNMQTRSKDRSLNGKALQSLIDTSVSLEVRLNRGRLISIPTTAYPFFNSRAV
jgi:hypothetical protein